MANPQGNIPNQLGAIWSRLQWSQRATIVIFAAAVMTGLGFLIFFMNRVDYQVLYRELNTEDAQAIAAKLKEDRINFLVSADGSSIQVAAPKEEVDKLRLEIAGSGLARSGRVGYEIFDKSQFGMTDFTEQVNYKRALEGELSRTVSSLAELAQARVHLVLPKDSLFEEKKEEAKASVLIRLRRGKELQQSSIAGIVNLVAGAVQGLQTYNVSVVDEQGRVLSRLMSSGDAMQTELGSGLRAQLEKEMATKVIDILEPVVGKGKVHANASIELDFNTSEQTEETYSPNPPVILSQQKSEERVGSGSAAAGVPGTRSNQAGAAPSAVSVPERVRQSESTNYEVNKLIRHTVQPKGSVRRISVAVILDHKMTYGKDAQGAAVQNYSARSKEELDAYRQLVLAAVGFQADRGDTVTLENMPFFSESAPEGEPAPAAWYVSLQPFAMPAMKYAAFLVLFVIVYLVVFRPLRSRVYQSLASAARALGPAAPVPALPEAKLKALAGPVSAGSLPAASSEAAAAGGALPATSGSSAVEEDIEQEFLKEAEMAGPGQRRFEVLKHRALEHASKEPEQLSQLIRTWLYET